MFLLNSKPQRKVVLFEKLTDSFDLHQHTNKSSETTNSLKVQRSLPILNGFSGVQISLEIGKYF